MLTTLLFAQVSAISQITFCMVTSERPVSYLERVLATYQEQRVSQMDGVGLIVVNMDGTHLGNSVVHPRTRKLAGCDMPDVEGRPICKVRQSTLDVTESLLYCANRTSGWVVLVEDDCEACPGSIQEIVAELSRLDAVAVSLAKFSKFSRGVAFPVGKVEAYAKNAQAHVYEKPYDFFDVEDWDPHGGGAHIYAHNVFHHIGTVSTITYRNEEEYRKNYDTMRSDFCGEPLA
jgi:hypothetical protein